MDRSYGGRLSMPAPQDPPKWTGAMGEAPACQRLRTPPKWTGAIGEGPACRRLRTHLNGQELWGKPQHLDVTPTSPGRHPNIIQIPFPFPPFHQVLAYTPGTSSPAKVAPNSPFDVRSVTGKARVTPPRWTGAMGEAPACLRIRTHRDGQELWLSLIHI